MHLGLFGLEGDKVGEAVERWHVFLLLGDVERLGHVDAVLLELLPLYVHGNGVVDVVKLGLALELLRIVFLDLLAELICLGFHEQSIQARVRTAQLLHGLRTPLLKLEENLALLLRLEVGELPLLLGQGLRSGKAASLLRSVEREDTLSHVVRDALRLEPN